MRGWHSGAATKVSHNIYIWDRATGTLVKVLEGPKDSLDDCDVSISALRPKQATGLNYVPRQSGIPRSPLFLP